MPETTRPTYSNFMSLIKSKLSIDSSLKRIIEHPGGKNFNTIFGYITSLAYKKVMLTDNDEGMTGKQVFLYSENNWLSPKEFLEEMKFEVTPYSQFAIIILFNSFAQDGALELKGKYPNYQYKFVEDMDFPEQKQLEETRRSNETFMQIIDDLMEYLPESLNQGKPVTSRQDSSLGPLWEAFLSDPLIDVFRDEMSYQTLHNLPELPPDADIKIVILSTGIGIGTVELLERLIQRYQNINLSISCYEEIPNLLKRGKERILLFDKKNKQKIVNKEIKIEYKFKEQKLDASMPYRGNSVDLVQIFQSLQYIEDERRYDLFDRIAKMLKTSGLLVVGQNTSYSEEFPHPMSMMLLPVENFHGYPLKDEMEKMIKPFYGNYSGVGNDSIWVVKDPK